MNYNERKDGIRGVNFSLVSFDKEMKGNFFEKE